VRYLRSVLDWRNRKDDRFIAALCLGALHGESHRSPNCFSNYNKDNYWTFIQASMRGLAPLLAERARMVIRIGGRRLRKAELRQGLVRSLRLGLGRDVRLVDDGVTMQVGKTQANVFRGSKVSRFEEHDFCFAV